MPKVTSENAFSKITYKIIVNCQMFINSTNV